MSAGDRPPPGDVPALVARLGDALGTAMQPVTVQEELAATVSRVRHVSAAAACSFARIEPDGGSLRFVAAEGAGADRILGVQLPLGRGIAGWAALAGEPIMVADVARDSRFARDVAESTSYIPTTILAAPVVDLTGTTVGVIEVLDPAAGGDAGHQLAMLGLVAAQLSAVIRLATMYGALGTGLLRTLVDPDDSGSFDEAISALEEQEDAWLTGVARAFRELASADPAAVRLAERVLAEVADFVRERP